MASSREPAVHNPVPVALCEGLLEMKFDVVEVGDGRVDCRLSSN